jgi:hypothetical protein
MAIPLGYRDHHRTCASQQPEPRTPSSRDGALNRMSGAKSTYAGEPLCSTRRRSISTGMTLLVLSS